MNEYRVSGIEPRILIKCPCKFNIDVKYMK